MPATKLSPEEIREKRTLSDWQILSKSALLSAQFERVMPSPQRSKPQLLITADQKKYLLNLKEVDEMLDGVRIKTPEQAKLADDIKALRSIDSTAEDSKRALQIVEQWK
ncbi:hypothetical protein LP416_13335 [Polaromonas sp. P2-4]|nr:hypothetical protein LP416_13335 [Polaromonas sp. P2-4]